MKYLPKSIGKFAPPGLLPRPGSKKLQVILMLANLSLLTSCGQAEFNGGGNAKPAPQTPPGPSVDPKPAVVKPPAPSKEVVFGADKVYHIGNNDYSGSSCKDKIDPYPLSGNTYYFQFDVLEPATVVDVQIKTICGVDYTGSNAARIINGILPIQNQPLQADSSGVTFTSMTLNPGHYAVLVQSARNFSKNADNDDFLVGDITIKASKQIVGGQVRTE